MNKFFQNEDGAVTVDWVLLTASVIGLCIAVFLVVSSGAANLSGDTVDTLGSGLITSTFN